MVHRTSGQLSVLAGEQWRSRLLVRNIGSLPIGCMSVTLELQVDGAASTSSTVAWDEQDGGGAGPYAVGQLSAPALSLSIEPGALRLPLQPGDACELVLAAHARAPSAASVVRIVLRYAQSSWLHVPQQPETTTPRTLYHRQETLMQTLCIRPSIKVYGATLFAQPAAALSLHCQNETNSALSVRCVPTLADSPPRFIQQHEKKDYPIIFLSFSHPSNPLSFTRSSPVSPPSFFLVQRVCAPEPVR